MSGLSLAVVEGCSTPEKPFRDSHPYLGLLFAFQGDGDNNVLWSCRAGLSGDVPVCGLRGEHHLLAWACAGLPVREAETPGTPGTPGQRRARMTSTGKRRTPLRCDS